MKFEVVKRFEGENINFPTRKTAYSAGYDFEVAKDTLIPPYYILREDIIHEVGFQSLDEPRTLEEMSKITSKSLSRPTLVPTGIKAKLDRNTYLELSVRSSCPYKHWLVLANGVGIIDADYYGNPSNDGEIFFQVINFSPIPIILKKGDIIGQGIIKQYKTVEDDNATGTRKGGFGSTSK